MCNDTSSTVAQHNVEVDDEGYADSSYGDSLQSYTTSLTSSIKNHSYENGRRYHAYQEGKYFAPNDESESDRLDMHHHLSTLMLNGRLHLAPIKKAPRILDIGTGTGIWAIQMGDEYAAAEVIGVDLSPTQPTMIPPNVRFEVDDVEEDWTYSAPFDYIHTRLMAGSIQDWPRLVEQTYKFLKPNGYVEFKDWDTNPISEDDSLPKEGYISQYHTLLFDGMEKMGRDHCPGPKLRKLVEDAGFVDVKEVITPIPIGMWPKDKKLKEIGAWNYITLLEGLEGLSLRLFTSVLGWKIEELQVFLSHVRDELKDKSIHAQYHHHVVVGRKPTDDVEIDSTAVAGS